MSGPLFFLVRNDGWPVDYEIFTSAPSPREGWHVTTLAGLNAILTDPVEVARRHAQTAPVAEMVPQEISLRQLLFGLRDQGWISDAEALAAARTGETPGTLANLIANGEAAGQMSPEVAFAIRLTWAAMVVAYRSDPLWSMIVSAGIATNAQVDDVFRSGALR